MAIQIPVFTLVFLLSVGLFKTNAQNETCSFTTIFIEGGESCTFCNTNVTLETNTTSCNVTVMSIDFSPPSITCPDDVVVESSVDDVILPVSWEIPANATGVVTSTHKPNDTFPVGQTTTVFYLATRNMMTVICNFTVTVDKPPMETYATTSVPTTEGSTLQPEITTAESVPVSRRRMDPTKRPKKDNSELVLVLTTVAGFTLWILTLVIVSLVCWCQRCPPRCTLGDDTPKELAPPPARPVPRLQNGNAQVVESVYGKVGPLDHGYDNAPEGVRRHNIDEEVASVHSEGQVDLPAGSEGDGINLSPLGPEARPPATSTGDHHHDTGVNGIPPEKGIPSNTVLGMRRPVVPVVDDNNGSSDPYRNDDSNNNLYDNPVRTIPEDDLF